jgi:hypothetical protein
MLMQSRTRTILSHTLSAVALALTTLTAGTANAAVLKADFNGDGYEDLAVGIPGENVGNAARAGKVAVLYGRPNKGIGVLIDQGANGAIPETDDQFGMALTAGDFNGDTYPDLAIGHPYEDTGAQDNGAMTIVFGGSAGLSNSTRQYRPADIPGMPRDRFGRSLAAADFDDDGRDDLAIGTPYEDHNPRFGRNRRDVGKVTVFYGTPIGITFTNRSDWHQDKSGVESSRTADDLFGAALSIGDFNHDHVADLVVGVPGEAVAANHAGMVHIFYGTTSGLSSHTALGRETFREGVPGVDASQANGASEFDDRFGSALP